MNSNIILYDKKINSEIFLFFKKNIFIKNSQKIIFCYDESIAEIISLLFLKNKKNSKHELKKQDYKFLKKYKWKYLSIINGYEFISNNFDYEKKLCSYKLKEIFNKNINFINFNFKNNSIDNELIINPVNHDNIILKNDKINASIFYLNENGEINFFENYVDNIGTNIISIERDDENNFIQCINIGNRNILKSDKIVVFTKQKVFNKIIKNELNNSTIKTIKKHSNVTYILENDDV